MQGDPIIPQLGASDDPEQQIEPVGYDFGLSRRGFVQILSAGAGLMIVASAAPSLAQSRGRGGRGGREPINIDARLYIRRDGAITVMTGKVEGGQGSRAELTQAAAEELHVPAERITLLMGDTEMTPDDGITAGSGTTPRTLPAIQRACAAARNLLMQFAAEQWSVAPEKVEVRDGVAVHGENHLSYAEMVPSPPIEDRIEGAAPDTRKHQSLHQLIPADVSIVPAKEWKTLGTPAPRPNGREIVTGKHQFPYDMTLPGMLYGKILRRPSYGAKLVSVDLAAAKVMDGVIVVEDGSLVAVAAPTTHQARQAMASIESGAKWETSPHPASAGLFDYLRQHAGDIPANPFADEVARAPKALKATYTAAYIQHAPMEPRAAVASWADAKLTVWTCSQNPFGVRRELAGAFHIDEQRVRVIVPDFGGGFGGKHTGEAAVEAARLAQAAGKPVAVRWTRQEEFTWAYFRPAAVIDVEASLDDAGALTSWHFININSGPSGIETPYRAGRERSHYVQSQPPLRHGSYRALAATANNFARESFMDELAHAAGRDPLEFRLTHLGNPRLRAVLQEAAERFGWKARRGRAKQANVGVGLACATEKGAFVAAAAEVEIDRAKGAVHVSHICQAFECGAITNPGNLLSQVQGAIIMGLGAALRESMEFDGGRMLNASFWKYPVPRFADVPRLDIHLLNRPDLPAAGAGETPLIAVAPAVANGVFHATGARLRQLPLRLPPL